MTILLLDRSTGRVVSSWPHEVTLHTPTCRLWATMLDLHSSVEPLTPEAAQVAVDVLRTVGHPGPVSHDDWPLWVFDPRLLSRLLVHWRDSPLTPFVPTSGEPDAIPEGFAHLSPGTLALTSLYRACRGIITPAEVDSMELWQLGALLVVNEVADLPDAPEVAAGRYVRTVTRTDGSGKVHIASQRWERNPQRPLLYEHAKPMRMPDVRLRSTSPTQTGDGS